MRRDGQQEGERRRDAAHANLEAHQEPLVMRARRACIRTALERGEVTADDIRDQVPLPEGVDPRVFGAVPIALAREKIGILRRNGDRLSRRSVAHARRVSIWIIADPAKARAWLRAHPEPDPPERRPTQRRLFDDDEQDAAVAA